MDKLRSFNSNLEQCLEPWRVPARHGGALQLASTRIASQHMHFFMRDPQEENACFVMQFWSRLYLSVVFAVANMGVSLLYSIVSSLVWGVLTWHSAFHRNFGSDLQKTKHLCLLENLLVDWSISCRSPSSGCVEVWSEALLLSIQIIDYWLTCRKVVRATQGQFLHDSVQGSYFKRSGALAVSGL